jgi:hypothetical protein
MQFWVLFDFTFSFMGSFSFLVIFCLVVYHLHFFFVLCFHLFIYLFCDGGLVHIYLVFLLPCLLALSLFSCDFVILYLVFFQYLILIGYGICVF